MPKAVEALSDVQIVYVSCGSYHTIAIDKKGNLYAFGQNKYHKLGIHHTKSDAGEAMTVPVKIATYQSVAAGLSGEGPRKDRAEIVQVCAGFNHTLAIS